MKNKIEIKVAYKNRLVFMVAISQQYGLSLAHAIVKKHTALKVRLLSMKLAKILWHGYLGRMLSKETHLGQPLIKGQDIVKL